MLKGVVSEMITSHQNQSTEYYYIIYGNSWLILGISLTTSVDYYLSTVSFIPQIFLPEAAFFIPKHVHARLSIGLVLQAWKFLSKVHWRLSSCQGTCDLSFPLPILKMSVNATK